VPCLALIETMVIELNRQGGERGRTRIGQLEALQGDVEGAPKAPVARARKSR
jgi:hypothetical protein